MVCPRCGYDKWDGESTHDYAGRASAMVRCWGPKPARSRGAVLAAVGGAIVGPADVPMPAPAVVEPRAANEAPKVSKAALYNAALDSIAEDLKLKRASELDKPQPKEKKLRRPIKRKIGKREKR